MDPGVFPIDLFWGCPQRRQDGLGEDPWGVPTFELDGLVRHYLVAASAVGNTSSAHCVYIFPEGWRPSVASKLAS